MKTDDRLRFTRFAMKTGVFFLFLLAVLNGEAANANGASAPPFPPLCCMVLAIGLTGLASGAFCLYRCLKKKTELWRINQHMFRTLITALPDLAFLLDEHGKKIEFLNDLSFSSADTADTLQRKKLYESLDSEWLGRLTDAVRNANASGTVQRVDNRTSMPDGDLWLTARILPLMKTKGADRTALVILRNITAQKKK